MPHRAVRIRDAATAGAAAGLCAAILFATAHALIIVPIWDRMFGGLAFGATAGAIAGWSFTELYAADSGQPVGPARGAAYGALLWLAVAPVSAADAVLRATGVHEQHETLSVVVAIVLAAGAGSLWGWLRTHRPRGVLAGAAATLALTLAMGGPVPIARNTWAFGIFIAVLPASIVAGVVMATVLSVVRRRAAIIAPQ